MKELGMDRDRLFNWFYTLLLLLFCASVIIKTMIWSIVVLIKQISCL